jgi:2-polyprenyl-3-methyl-5-hydroxy-6-metoxy-1,4-benzoquinol methylase
MIIYSHENGSDRVYGGNGNESLLNLMKSQPARILDVGCGSGDNAAIIKSRFPSSEIVGITRSTKEADLARKYMKQILIFDLENGIPADLVCQQFDTIICSHVLEHLREPALTLLHLTKMLRNGGQILIAVPNVLSWRMRMQFLLGNFEYQTSGVLDDTHLRFFTYKTSDRLLLKSTELQIEYKSVTGNVPLWWLRRYILPKKWCCYIDRWGCRKWPNLFGNQTMIIATKIAEG